MQPPTVKGPACAPGNARCGETDEMIRARVILSEFETRYVIDCR